MLRNKFWHLRQQHSKLFNFYNTISKTDNNHVVIEADEKQIKEQELRAREFVLQHPNDPVPDHLTEDGQGDKSQQATSDGAPTQINSSFGG